MKHLTTFIVWQWQRWDAWQRTYALSLAFIIFGIFAPSFLGVFLLILGILMIVIWTIKWAIWDSIKESYKEFLKEREMKSQKPAEGIMKTGDWGTAKSYKVVCDCGQSDHDHNVWVESDETGINVTIYADVKTDFWSKNRWNQIWHLLIKGYSKYETVISMNEQEALNYAETLKTAIQDVKDLKEKRKNGTDQDRRNIL